MIFLGFEVWREARFHFFSLAATSKCLQWNPSFFVPFLFLCCLDDVNGDDGAALNLDNVNGAELNLGDHDLHNSNEENNDELEKEATVEVYCKLVIGRKTYIVTHGKVLITNSSEPIMLHFVPLEVDHDRVCITIAIKPIADLPIKHSDLKTVEDAVGCFVAWPKKYVILFNYEEHDHSQHIQVLCFATNICDERFYPV